MVTSFNRSCAHTATFSAPIPPADQCRPTPPPETPRHSQVSLAQSLVGSLLLSPGSWCTQGFVCVCQESVFPVLCKFCNQIPLVSKVKFLGVPSPFARSPGWEICCESENFLDSARIYLLKIILQFVDRLLSGSVVGLMVTSSKRAYSTGCVTQVAAP